MTQPLLPENLDDLDETEQSRELDDVQRGADETLEASRNMIGFEPEGWVSHRALRGSHDTYSKQQLKEDTLAEARSDEEWAEIAAHLILDDMDEEKYM
jgi:hypothetical protein